MAKRKARERALVKPAMAKHIRALGLADMYRYLEWCRQRGLACSLDKSKAEMEAELGVLAREAARLRERERILKDPVRLLEGACSGSLDPTNILRPNWRAVHDAIAAQNLSDKNRDQLCDFLVHVERTAGFVFEAFDEGPRPLLFIDALIHLFDRRAQWIRDYRDWQPGTHNRHRQLSSLLRHLLADYPVPAFMDSAWLRVDAQSKLFRDWFIHIGWGKNIRTARLPFPLTKKMAHQFLLAPKNYSIEEALVWAEIKALGGDSHLVDAVFGTRLGLSVECDAERRAFWSSVYRFFIAHPLLDRRHVAPIIDYLNYQKFESHEVVTGPGVVEVHGPPQPNLSMHGRTPDALLRQVERWHGRLRNHRNAANQFFAASRIPGLVLDTGAADENGRRSQWRIRELLSGAELITEGRRMRHCVASYAQSCAAGHCSIWTLERHYPDGRVDKHLTLEVTRTGRLIQARGRENRLPTDQENEVLEAWATSAKLTKGWYR